MSLAIKYLGPIDDIFPSVDGFVICSHTVGGPGDSRRVVRGEDRNNISQEIFLILISRQARDGNWDDGSST